MTRIFTIKQVIHLIIGIVIPLMLAGMNAQAGDTIDFNVLIIGCEPGGGKDFIVVRSSYPKLLGLRCSEALERFIGTGENAFQIEAATPLFNSGVVYTLVRTERLAGAGRED